MTTYRELVYLILDELKGDSDDFSYNENHILFLLSKYRAFLLKQRYSDIKKAVPETNYQKLEVLKSPIDQISTSKIYRVYSEDIVPMIMLPENTRVFLPENSYILNSETTFITRDRARYITYNRYNKNIIYSFIDENKKLICYMSDYRITDIDIFNNLELIAIFQDCLEVDRLKTNNTQELLDCVFPLEVNLTQPLIELVIKEITQAEYRPDDTINNGTDDLSKVNNDGQ